MKSVHFGAGNIGRGFIGQLLHESGYDITFVDIQDDLVDALTKEGHYEVILADEGDERIPVDRVTALHSVNQEDEIVQRLAEADLITTAVGPSVLPVLAPVIAKGLVERARRGGTPVNVIACENMVGASQALRGFVMEHVPDEHAEAVEEIAGFPNAAVDRIVPERQA
jgi:mannitol-1-phosphate 5-dehydrogenase